MALSSNYSLWLEPPSGSALSDRLRREIGAQARARGGPLFEPHVTLLPDVRLPEGEVLEAAAALAKSIKPFRVDLLNVASGPSFHQCVYILCAKEPPLLAANAAARSAYGKPEPEKPYMPHLSLLYSDITPEERQAAAAEAVARLWGEGSGYATLLPEAGFEAKGLTVWHTPVEDRTLESWRRVGEFEFGAGGGGGGGGDG